MLLSRRPILAGLTGLLLVGCNRREVDASFVELHIASDGDQMAFKPDHLVCRAGVNLRLVFHHSGQILDDPHDWVLLKQGTENIFVADADRNPDDEIAIPLQDRGMVIAATPYCHKGKTVTVEFTAPPPGDYPFVCSFPGHGETMRGVLTVKSS
jgi:uncharacterized cupredoxin-like copper-binding protein